MNQFQNKMAEFRQKSFLQRCESVAFGLLCAFLFGCTFTGGGHYLSVGFLTPRILTGALCILTALPVLFSDWRGQLKKPLNLLLLLLVLWLAVSAVRGIAAGNRTDVLKADVKGFVYLALIPVAAAVINSKRRLHTLLTVVLAGASVQAIAVLALNLFCTVFPEKLIPLGLFMLNSQLGQLSNVSESIFRIFMSSSPYLIVGCAITVIRQAQAPKLKLHYALLTALLLNALLLTFTRSLYGSAGIAALLTVAAALLLYPKNWKKLAVFLLITVACTGVIVGGEEFFCEANTFRFAISRTLHCEVSSSFLSTLKPKIKIYLEQHSGSGSAGEEKPGEGTLSTEQMELEALKKQEEEKRKQEEYLSITAASDGLRALTIQELRVWIDLHPAIGNGLGASAPSREGNDEYFYLDMLCRTGWIGLILYLLPFAYTLWQMLLARRRLRQNGETVAVLCGMAAFWIATALNPWMNAALGIAWYAVCCAVPTVLAAPETEND